MRSFERVTLGLIIVQEIIDELVIPMTIFSYITKYLARGNPNRRVWGPTRYVMNTRIPHQIRHLHRLVSVSDVSCLRNLRMDRNAFGRPCYMLQYSGGVTPTKHLSIPEQVAIFLSIVSHHKKNSVVKHDFIRSGRTIHKHFHRVLNSVIKLYNVLLARPTPITYDCVDPRWKWFKGCLGALDGTFIDVRVPEHEKGRYQTRKGHVSLNVLDVCNPNMKFIYVLSGWEGSAADSHVLRDAVHRPGGLRVSLGLIFELHDPRWKWFKPQLLLPRTLNCNEIVHTRLLCLMQANAEGFLTPYRGVRYHLCEWDAGVRGPQNYREFFNLKHASAHGWGILRSQSFYLIKVQSRIILACCLPHNFLRQEMLDDPLEHDLPTVGLDEWDNEHENVWNIETNPKWTSWRDTLAMSMCNEWTSCR
ncbi:UNVERIFIED_CONTAM: hypothetical protein Sindi_2030200 [Sesamum indicum]